MMRMSDAVSRDEVASDDDAVTGVVPRDEVASDGDDAVSDGEVAGTVLAGSMTWGASVAGGFGVCGFFGFAVFGVAGSGGRFRDAFPGRRGGGQSYAFVCVCSDRGFGGVGACCGFVGSGGVDDDH